MFCLISGRPNLSLDLFNAVSFHPKVVAVNIGLAPQSLRDAREPAIDLDFYYENCVMLERSSSIAGWRVQGGFAGGTTKWTAVGKEVLNVGT